MSMVAEIVKSEASESTEKVANRCIQLLRQRDLRFVVAVVALRKLAVLKQVATAWTEDSSKWARQEEERYLEMGPIHPSHRAVIRTLIWKGIHYRRHRTLAIAMVYLDQSIDRYWKYEYRLDRSTNPFKVKTIAILQQSRLLSRKARTTRRALRMRSTCYFQRLLFHYMMRLAAESPDEYVSSMGYAWRHYRNEKTTEGIALIQRTCLLRTLFAPSERLLLTRNGFELSSEGTLQQWLESDVSLPHEGCWRTSLGIRELKRVAEQASSDLIRFRARQLLTRFQQA